MNSQQVSIERQEIGVFSEKNWIDLTNRISLVFNFNKQQKRKLQTNKLAKLIAGIPFIACCNEPERTALSHLSIVYLATHEACKDLSIHNFTDNASLLQRLERISHFDGGNQLIIDRGMNLLAIIMIADHIKDSVEDKQKKKYNPLVSGIWDAQKQIDILEIKIDQIECDEMERIISVKEARAGYWEPY